MASSAPVPAELVEVPAYRPRNYQLEMLEASMRENIIVAMDTGSGKTHIALLRIIRELELRSPQKLIWFLAPTVALCMQQHSVIRTNIPAVRSRTLTGLDKVELWTEQSIWDAVLKDIQVVVSTHAVLADALTHGFVRMEGLGLIIFDEAHHCIERHPANKIMQDFYHPTLAKHGLDAVPRILGLTASPVMRSSKEDLEQIESNLNAVCKTPRAHRQELLTHTHRPILEQIWYTPLYPLEIQFGSKSLSTLEHAFQALNIEDDPYVKKLRRSPLDGKELQKVLETEKTYCRKQLKRFINRCRHIFEELGSFAVDYFIHASTDLLRQQVRDSSMMIDWDDEEKAFLLSFLSRVCISCENTEHMSVSPKFQALLDFLESNDDPDFSGLLFVKQRATVSVMAHLLAIHPKTKDRFRCAAYCGWSGGSSRKDILGELLTMQMQRGTLDDFRSGRKNLIISTDVLEEGIDISACSLVICYDKPPNLKSFVQRRGRARRKQWTYVIFFSRNDATSDVIKFEELERAMVEAYQDDERRVKEAIAQEAINEEIVERFWIDSTSALLTPDTAVSHLHHFCAVLPQQAYVDNRPDFSFDPKDPNKDGLVQAIVTLPSCVNPAVRRTRGNGWWRTERAAIKEVCFLAYKALYLAGLVNDHLLPVGKREELQCNNLPDLPSVVETSEQYDP